MKYKSEIIVPITLSKNVSVIEFKEITMKITIILACIFVFIGCTGNKETNEIDRFFIQWLESHGEENIVNDETGIGIKNNNTRLNASIYKVDINKDQSYMVEIEFRIRFNNKEIIEYLAGIGETKEQAINDTLLNFALTTFHVVYKGLINQNDPHQPVEKININGTERDLLMGDIYTRTGENGENDELTGMHDIKKEIKKMIAPLKLSKEIHWIKIVYGQNNSVPILVAVTIDNYDRQDLNEKIKAIGWPKSNYFYMSKLFILIK